LALGVWSCRPVRGRPGACVLPAAVAHESSNPRREIVRIRYLALPDRQNRPPHRTKPGDTVSVAAAVPADLRQPVILVRLRFPRASPAVVAVPETAVDEDGFLTPGEDYIGIPRKTFTMNPVTRKARPPKHPPHGDFRTGVAGAHGPHGAAAPLRKVWF